MKCPKCGAEMREKSGRYGRFLGCSNWPRCNGARDLKPTDNSTPTKPTRRCKAPHSLDLRQCRHPIHKRLRLRSLGSDQQRSPRAFPGSATLPVDRL